MNSAPLASALTRLRSEAASHSAEDRSAVQLLRAYVAANDQAAFAALVRRYGPIVFGVCRRVLQDVHDAEDAFQAVFLTLARKAATLRNGEALSCWLHGVSYRTAMSAKRDTARRRQHESRVAPRSNPPAWEVGWRELQAVLDEEVQRLAPTYRAAFVLCCLEGLSKAEAAERLGAKANTVSSRLARARKRLQGRLARRGISLSAVLAALAVSSAGRAAVPPRLVRVATAAASQLGAGVPVTGLSARVISLAEGVTRTMFSTKVKVATVLLLCVLGTGVGVFARPGAEPPAAPRVRKTPAAPQTPAKEGAEGVSTYAGRVLDPDGKPFAGAKVHLLYSTPKVLPLPVRATSGKDGSFRFTAERKDFDQSASVRPWDNAVAVATAPGYGFGVPALQLGKRLEPGDLTLQLAKDDMPITGRILDLQGKPIAGVTVRVHEVFWPTKVDLTAWLRDLKEKKEGYPALRRHLIELGGAWMGRDAGRLSPAAVTGADGRFRLAGVGRERVVGLRLVGPTVAASEVWAMTRPGGTIRAARWRRGSGDPEMIFYGFTFEHVMGPCRPVAGVVRDRDTGKPISGATVESYAFSWIKAGRDFLRAITDKEGRYRLLGMPKGRGNLVRVVGPEGQPYLMALADVPEGPGIQSVTVDVRLKRGVWVSGTVTDKATGKPVHSIIRWGVFEDNPFRKEAPGLTFPEHFSTRAQDGSFRFAVLPGRSVMTVQAWAGGYLTGVGAEKLKGVAPPFGMRDYFNTAVEINPTKGAAAVRCDIALDPGRTLTGTVTDADGRPLAGAKVAGLGRAGGGFEQPPLRTAAFTVTALKPGEVRLLQFAHPEKRLAGSVVVRGAKGPLTVKLGPAGTLTGRFVLPDGKPLADLELSALLRDPIADPRLPPKPPDPTVGSIPRGLRTDKDGKFRIEGLAPGLTYRLGVFKGRYFLSPEGPAAAVRVEAGKTKDLGNVTIKPIE